MSGTQRSILNDKVDSYKTAKERLDAAKRAPYSPTAEKQLNDAQRDRNRAWSDVNSAYSTYDEDMRNGGHTPDSLRDILSSRGTSEH